MSIISNSFFFKTFLRIGDDENQSSIQNRFGSIMFFMFSATFPQADGAASTFPIEKAIVRHEYSNYTYHVSAYYIAKVMAEVPFELFFMLVSTIIYYFLVGYQVGVGEFFIFYVRILFLFTHILIVFFQAAIVLTALISALFGICVGAAVSNIAVAAALVPIVIIPIITFSGFFLNAADAPPYFVWIQHISYFRYVFEILLVNEMEGLTFECDIDEFVTAGNVTICPITTGEQVIDQYDFDTGIYARNFGILVAIWVFLFMLGLGILSLGMRKKRT